MKYNYFEIKKSHGGLPEDVNLPVDQAIDKLFASIELKEIMAEYRTKRRFGSLEFAKNHVGVKINFVSGIVPEYVLYGRTKTSGPEFIVHQRTVKNDNLAYPKEKL